MSGPDDHPEIILRTPPAARRSSFRPRFGLEPSRPVPAQEDPGPEPGDAPAFLDRGRKRLDAGDLDGALRDFDEAVRLKPDDPFALGCRATARHHLDDLAGAVEDFDRAIAADPDMAWLYNGSRGGPPGR